MTRTARGTYLHIGAGAAETLPPEAGPEGALRCVLVEPNPVFSEDLDRFPALRAGGPKVIRAAVDAQDSKAAFHVFNLPELSRLDPPSAALRDLMPGLRVIEQPEVLTVSVETLLSKVKLRGDANRLMLEAAGREAMIISELIRLEALAGFARIDLRSGPQAPDAPELTALEQQLIEQGFDVQTAPDPDDPDWIVLRARRNDARIEMARRLAELEAARGHLEQKLQQSETRAEEAEAALNTLTTDHKAARANHDRSLATLESARDQARERVANLSERLAERDARIAALEQELRQAGETADAQARALKQARTHGAALEQQLTEARQSDDIAAWQTRCETAQDDLRLALQMQAVAVADLKDLQTRYATLHDQKADQDRLLAQLVARLDEAAEHLHRLALPNGDSHSGAVLEPAADPAPDQSRTPGRKGKSPRKTPKPRP